MRKPLYNIIIFIFHIITLILLFTLCIHFNVIELFKKEYPDYENMSEFLKLPVAQQNKISRKVQKKASKIYLKYRIRNFFK